MYALLLYIYVIIFEPLFFSITWGFEISMYTCNVQEFMEMGMLQFSSCTGQRFGIQATICQYQVVIIIIYFW